MDNERRSHIGTAITSTIRALTRDMTGQDGERPTPGTVNQSLVDAVLDTWESEPKEVAGHMIEKYGLPNEACESRLIWYENGSWKRTIVYRDEMPHNFPKPHTDLLEQFIDYRVPVERFSDLAAFDGSVIPERTKGELSTRCDVEPMNFLAINLAHDVVTGRRSVDEAREYYAEVAGAFMAGRSETSTERLMFDLAKEKTADPDDTKMVKAMSGMVAGKPGKSRKEVSE
jgi:hypothetical protein